MTANRREMTVILRWTAVLPGAVVGALAASWVLHAILYVTLARGETVFGVNTDPIEFALHPAAISLGFVVGGFEIAPSRKMGTAVVLVSILILATLVVLVAVPSSHLDVRSLGSIVGAGLGVATATARTRTPSRPLALASHPRPNPHHEQ